MSLIEPACEFSTATTPNSARPAITVSKIAAKVAQGTASIWPKIAIAASSVFVPGLP